MRSIDIKFLEQFKILLEIYNATLYIEDYTAVFTVGVMSYELPTDEDTNEVSSVSIGELISTHKSLHNNEVTK